jgi:homocysteine S-methyltransferase
VQPEVPLGERSAWGRKLADGAFVVSLEITPPKGWELDEMFGQCRRIQEAGADSVNVLDSPHAPGRMSGLPAALLIEREVGIETIVHYPCRDRNMPRMISDLLGAAAGGVRNLLLVTGRPPAHGPFPDANPPLDIDSIGLTNVVRGLNQGVDPGGNTIGSVTRFVIGVRVNQIAAERETELSRLTWKVGAGAQFVVTQPVFAPERLEAFQARTSELSVPLVAGLRPLTSLREAEFLHNEVPGIYLPDTVLSRMAEATASGPSAAKEEGVRIALETFEAIRDSVQGVHINVPPENLEGALEILAEVRRTHGDGG